MISHENASKYNFITNQKYPIRLVRIQYYLPVIIDPETIFVWLIAFNKEIFSRREGVVLIVIKTESESRKTREKVVLIGPFCSVYVIASVGSNFYWLSASAVSFGVFPAERDQAFIHFPIKYL